MVEIVNTADLRLVQHQDGSSKLFLGKEEVPEQACRDIYCGLDSCLTLEIYSRLAPKLDQHTSLIYGFSRALQAPVLEMMLRGILTDPYAVADLLYHYGSQQERLYEIIQRFALVIWGTSLNPRSPKQLKEILYETIQTSDLPPKPTLALPKQYKFEKGKRTLSTNRDSLEKLLVYRYSRPLILAVLKHRDVSKKIGVLKSGINSDGRMRFSYNIGGTNTGRFSCNKNVFGGGTNGQNITDELRRIFIAAEGRKFAYLDLAQAESRSVAYLSGDENYIKACESSDLHTFVARYIWPELDWAEPGHNLSQDEADKLNKELAEKKFWRHWSRRDLTKRGGHLTNYYGQAQSNAKKLHVSIDVMKHFQRTYFKEFKGISRMHRDTARILGVSKQMITPLGRKRLFFGRVFEDDVLRKGIAYPNQSSVGDILNLGLWRIWRFLPEADLLAQLHDAVLLEYNDDPEVEQRVIQQATKLMTVSVEVTDMRLRNPMTRTMVIPVDATVGWNWAKHDAKTNPDGLVPYDPESIRVRRLPPSLAMIHRPI